MLGRSQVASTRDNLQIALVKSRLAEAKMYAVCMREPRREGAHGEDERLLMAQFARLFPT